MKSTELISEYKKNRKAPKFNIKPRTGHAPTQTGAGAHKDKKKAEKQGDFKHKKKEIEESFEQRLARRLDELSIDTLKSYQEKSKAWSDKEKENDPNPERGSEAWMKRVYRAQGRSNARRKIDQKERGVTVGEAFDAEYDDEAGMSHNSLKTIHRAAVGLIDTIQNGDNLPEWCQEKISLAEDYLVTVWDYLQSEEGTDESMEERFRDPEDWDEGNTEPPNNMAIYINGKLWKVFQGNGYYADDERERAQYYKLKDWARKKSEQTGKKWEVSITGAPATA